VIVSSSYSFLDARSNDLPAEDLAAYYHTTGTTTLSGLFKWAHSMVTAERNARWDGGEIGPNVRWNRQLRPPTIARTSAVYIYLYGNPWD